MAVVGACLIALALTLLIVALWPRRREPTMTDQMHKAMNAHTKQWREDVERNIAAEQRERDEQEIGTRQRQRRGGLAPVV